MARIWAIAAVWRIESARIVASLARMTRDVGVAEELAQDALVAALEHWPRQGVPDKPGAWLMTTARHRALDHLRRAKNLDAKLQEIGHDLEAREALVVPDFVDALDAARQDEIGDDLLRLIFTACHPVLSTEARVALTLKLLGGLTTHEIARACLVPEPTIAQRIVRAKRTLREAHVPYEVPRGQELADRLASVLEVIYLVFNEGYTATSGGDWMRPALAQEAAARAPGAAHADDGRRAPRHRHRAVRRAGSPHAAGQEPAGDARCRRRARRGAPPVRQARRSPHADILR